MKLSIYKQLQTYTTTSLRPWKAIRRQTALKILSVLIFTYQHQTIPSTSQQILRAMFLPCFFEIAWDPVLLGGETECHQLQHCNEFMRKEQLLGDGSVFAQCTQCTLGTEWDQLCCSSHSLWERPAMADGTTHFSLYCGLDSCRSCHPIAGMESWQVPETTVLNEILFFNYFGCTYSLNCEMCKDSLPRLIQTAFAPDLHHCWITIGHKILIYARNSLNVFGCARMKLTDCNTLHKQRTTSLKLES